MGETVARRRDSSNRTPSRNDDGFTLAELLIVVSLIGVLASLSIPNFTKLAQKSRRVEAYESLRAIYVAQTDFFTQNGVFAQSFDELGFQISAAKRIDSQTYLARSYTFTIEALDLNGNERGNFRALATGDIDPEDPVLDILIIENQLTVFD